MLSKIRENLLFTLTNEELVMPYEKAMTLLNKIDDTGAFPDLAYECNDPGNWSWCAHVNRLTKIAANQRVMATEANVKTVLLSLSYFMAKKRENSNWWYKQIGLPRYIGRLFLLLEDRLTPEDKATLLPYIEEGTIALHPNVLRSWVGANLLWGVMGTITHAIIVNDASHMKIALDAAAKELDIHAGNAQGIQSDYSFFQHQTQFYSGGYGRAFAENFAQIIYTLKDTEYQFPNEALNTLGYYIVFGLRYCVRNYHFDYLTVGRQLSRPDDLNAEKMRKAMWLLMKVEEMPCRDVMQEQLASMCAEMYSVRKDRFFWESNFYVSRTVTSHISCKGTSPLRSLGETINGENQLSANLYAGGATCIMVDGKEYNNIFPLWDFSHVPGTTAPVETDSEIVNKCHHWHGKNADNNYCRGISHNNHGLIYQDLNFDGVTGVISRFFIDGVMIALGAGLNYTDEKQVTTTINQCWQKDAVRTEQDGLPKNSLYQGLVAYASLDGQPIVCNTEKKSGCWSRIQTLATKTEEGSVCTLYIDHGKAPKNASYAYAVIPAVSSGGAAQRIQDVLNDVTVLRNDDAIQAIRYKNQLFCVFHKGGTFDIALYNKIESSGQTAWILDI